MANGRFRFPRRITSSLDESTGREWLETNGLGGFASSTISGMDTRRYYRLLVAATTPPTGRMVMLSKVEETLGIAGERYELSTNQYPGVIHPRGYEYLDEFRLDPFPIFTYKARGVVLENRVFLVHGENTAVIEYELLSGPRCTLELRPLIAFRDYHSTTHKNHVLNGHVDSSPGLIRMRPYEGLPALYLSHTDASLDITGHWYENFEYSEEQARGLPYREDLFNPCLLSFALRQHAGSAVIASLEPRAVATQRLYDGSRSSGDLKSSRKRPCRSRWYKR